MGPGARYTRREFLGRAAGAAAAVPLCDWAMAATGGAGAGRKPPNIVVILADDMGYCDLGCYGSEIDTPNLDRMAADGIRFTHGYNAARCCPSRAALLTGLYPHQAGMGDMVSPVEPLRPEGPYQGYLNRRCVTIAEALKPAGYRTYMSGKWHVGEARPFWPRKRGFDRYYGLISGGSSYWEILPEERDRRIMARDDEPCLPEGENFYMTDAFSEFAVRCINEHDAPGTPFFLYLAYTAPHWPMHAWPEDIAKYRGTYQIGWDELRNRRYTRLVEMGIIDPKWRLSPRDDQVPAWTDVSDKDEWDLRMSVYAAMIDRMDQGIGRVLRALKDKGVEDNTLVLFLSDNGGCHENIDKRKLHKPGTRAGERGSFVAYERPWANASNTPFRLFKHWVHEGGIATPVIARWPAGIRERGKLTHQVAHITDIMSTCIDIAGAEYPKSVDGIDIHPVQGKSLLPIFQGKTREPHARLFWEHEKSKAVREGNLKFVAPQQGDWELYDIEADRTELNNLKDKYPEKAARMLETWLKWAGDVGAEI